MEKLTNLELTKQLFGGRYSYLDLHCSLERLIELLGNPTKIGSPDNKIQLEWIFIDGKGDDINSLVQNGELNEMNNLTIYDWKSYDWPEYKTINEIKHWHIGRKGLKKEEVQIELINLGFDPIEEIVDTNPNRN